jgi:hypothetical protein
MAQFKKGMPRPANAGIKKGTKHKRKVAALYDALLENGCDFDETFAKALVSADAPLIKVLIDVMPWIRPKFKEIAENEKSQFEELREMYAHVSTEELEKSIMGESWYAEEIDED